MGYIRLSNGGQYWISPNKLAAQFLAGGIPLCDTAILNGVGACEVCEFVSNWYSSAPKNAKALPALLKAIDEFSELMHRSA